jgi:MYXO-CTERM domain-containing protein
MLLVLAAVFIFALSACEGGAENLSGTVKPSGTAESSRPGGTGDTAAPEEEVLRLIFINAVASLEKDMWNVTIKITMQSAGAGNEILLKLDGDNWSMGSELHGADGDKTYRYLEHEGQWYRVETSSDGTDFKSFAAIYAAAFKPEYFEVTDGAFTLKADSAQDFLAEYAEQTGGSVEGAEVGLLRVTLENDKLAKLEMESSITGETSGAISVEFLNYGSTVVTLPDAETLDPQNLPEWARMSGGCGASVTPGAARLFGIALLVGAGLLIRRKHFSK